MDTPIPNPANSTIDPSQFPLTTQEGLSDDQQHLIDSINLDELHEAIRFGEVLNSREQAVLKELEAKQAIRDAAHAAKRNTNATRTDEDPKRKDLPS